MELEMFNKETRFVREKKKEKKKYHCKNQNLNLNTERHRQTSLWIGFLIIRLFGNLKVRRRISLHIYTWKVLVWWGNFLIIRKTCSAYQKNQLIWFQKRSKICLLQWKSVFKLVNKFELLWYNSWINSFCTCKWVRYAY